MIDPRVRAIYYIMFRVDEIDNWGSDTEAYICAFEVSMFPKNDPNDRLGITLEKLVIEKGW